MKCENVTHKARGRMNAAKPSLAAGLHPPPVDQGGQDMKKSPKHVVDVGFVPHGQQSEREQQPGRYVARGGDNGEVDVIATPTREADVPTLPKFTDVLRGEGSIEVVHDSEACHGAEAHCHLGIAGKLEIGIEGEPHGLKIMPTQCGQSFEPSGRSHGQEVIANESQFEQPQDHFFETVREQGGVPASPTQINQKGGEPVNGTDQQDGRKELIGEKIHHFVLGQIAFVDLDLVRNLAKQKVGNAQRQPPAERLETEEGSQSCDAQPQRQPAFCHRQLHRRPTA